MSDDVKPAIDPALPCYSEVTLGDIMKYFIRGYTVPAGMQLDRYEHWIDTTNSKVIIKIWWRPLPPVQN